MRFGWRRIASSNASLQARTSSGVAQRPPVIGIEQASCSIPNRSAASMTESGSQPTNAWPLPETCMWASSFLTIRACATSDRAAPARVLLLRQLRLPRLTRAAARHEPARAPFALAFELEVFRMFVSDAHEAPGAGCGVDVRSVYRENIK